MQSLGLYLSVPFCRSKCTFCNFASGVYPSSYFGQYVARLEQDLRTIHERSDRWNAVLPEIVDTVYLGGGTPSILPPHLIQRMFGALRREFVVLPGAEITVECAPGQLADDMLAAMVEAGVNRVSFGVQSFIDAEAKSTGRLHTRAIALEDIRRVHAAGIQAVNVDLIAGLPGQTVASWRESLEVLAGTGVDHANVYMFEVDEDSRLGLEIVTGGQRYRAAEVPSDDLMADMYSTAIDFLAGQGIAQYEISNFARLGSESVHNLKYWKREPYLGVGVDAHSMLRTASGAALRFATTDELQSFLNHSGWDEPHLLSREEELEEAWFLGLRLNDGVSLAALRAEFGSTAIREIEPVLIDLECEELIAWNDDRVSLTGRGRLLSNEVFARFLAEPVPA